MAGVQARAGEVTARALLELDADELDDAELRRLREVLAKVAPERLRWEIFPPGAPLPAWARHFLPHPGHQIRPANRRRRTRPVGKGRRWTRRRANPRSSGH